MNQPKIIPEIMDLKSIVLLPETSPPAIVTVSEQDGFFINPRRSEDFRIRATVYDMMKQAQKSLPAGVHFMLFETYRTFQKQKTLWDNTNNQMKSFYPDLDAVSLMQLCENFTANPHDGIGSGHQAACAIDITLCDGKGHEFDMGTAMHEKNEKTKTVVADLTPAQSQHRQLLKKALEDAGFINYPAEWWHFSYGDHQWAFLTGKKEAIYGIIDI